MKQDNNGSVFFYGAGCTPEKQPIVAQAIHEALPDDALRGKILIADAGSTKTDWAIITGDNNVTTVRTSGLNPFQLTMQQITEEIRQNLLPTICKYESDGGRSQGSSPVTEVIVASDMLGAARAICGHKPGIACILGTGSNSCAFDGTNITKNVSPLGFILGDEGSGAVMGKILVGDVLKNQLPEHIRDCFFEKYKLTAAEIIDRVYRQPKPNTFLASFVPFLEENLNEPEIYSLVKESFRSFLRRNVKQYDGWQSLPIGFNGSIASIYRKPLEEVLNEEGMHLGKIVQAPMQELIKYHTT